MYRDHFLPRQEIPLGYEIFEVVLGELLRYDFGSNEIIGGFKKIKFVDSRLQICIKKFAFYSSGETYSNPSEAYKRIFNKKDVRNAFEKVFKKCIDKGIKPEQIGDLNLQLGVVRQQINDTSLELENDILCSNCCFCGGISGELASLLGHNINPIPTGCILRSKRFYKGMLAGAAIVAVVLIGMYVFVYYVYAPIVSK